ncbi:MULTISPECIES: hypothetical protein [Streptomycetaceae]|uniref:hypothetical protein n=1 Tax=Streptomycetaceae TaxID=2062 RepID=UPI000ACADF4D|nr:MULTISPECIES: hypothetical protein [Streptomycetaceae]MYS59874.1 hypothetical protein [Streptomyces sp. SID5468]
MWKKVLPYWGLIALVLAVTGWLTSNFGPSGIATLSALSLLWFLFQAPNPCGAPIRAAGKSCRNNARGVLRGCHLQQHKWQRMRTFFVHPRLRSCAAQLFANPVTGLASLGGIVTLISTVINISLALSGKGSS